jgi:hypothetical protein
MGASPMDEQSKKQELQKVPTRKLLSAIKQDIRKTMKEATARGKPLKRKRLTQP